MRGSLLLGGIALVCSACHCRGVSLLAQGAPYSFKGNSLGMTLDEFKKQNFHGYVYYDKKGNLTKAGKKNALPVATPVCTDSPVLSAQPAVRANLDPDEAICPEENPGFAGLWYAQVRYRFFKGRLYQVESTFGSADYPQAKEAFIAKYGPVNETRQMDYENSFGARWQGEVSLWRHGSEAIVMMEGPDNGPGQDRCLVRKPTSGDCLVPKPDASAVLRDDALAPPAKPAAPADF